MSAQQGFCHTTPAILLYPCCMSAQPPKSLSAEQGNELPGQDKCSADSYVILPHKSRYVDQQTLKLQARPHPRVAGAL